MSSTTLPAGTMSLTKWFDRGIPAFTNMLFQDIGMHASAAYKS